MPIIVMAVPTACTGHVVDTNTDDRLGMPQIFPIFGVVSVIDTFHHIWGCVLECLPRHYVSTVAQQIRLYDYNFRIVSPSGSCIRSQKHHGDYQKASQLT
jgi:hypothetical protein